MDSGRCAHCNNIKQFFLFDEIAYMQPLPLPHRLLSSSEEFQGLMKYKRKNGVSKKEDIAKKESKQKPKPKPNVRMLAVHF